MSKFCPEWIFGIFAAQTSKEFLSSNNSIAAISRKYSAAKITINLLNKFKFSIFGQKAIDDINSIENKLNSASLQYQIGMIIFIQ